MLHQVAEHGLNGLLPLMQFRIRHTTSINSCAGQEDSVWIHFKLIPRSTNNETSLFQILQKAYIHARYKDSFQISAKEVTPLQERVKLLLQLVSEEFLRFFIPSGVLLLKLIQHFINLANVGISLSRVRL